MTWQDRRRPRAPGSILGILVAVRPVSAGDSMIWRTVAEWHDYLSLKGAVPLANFWTRSKTGMHIEPGAPFFFKRARTGLIVGYGIFRRKLVMSIGEAWKRYGDANGAATLQDKILRARGVLGIADAGPDTKIGCIELTDVTFFPEDRWVRLSDYGISAAITFKKIPASTANDILAKLGHA